MTTVVLMLLSAHDHDVRSSRPCSGVSSDRQPLWNGLSGTQHPQTKSVRRELVDPALWQHSSTSEQATTTVWDLPRGQFPLPMICVGLPMWMLAVGFTRSCWQALEQFVWQRQFRRLADNLPSSQAMSIPEVLSQCYSVTAYTVIPLVLIGCWCDTVIERQSWPANFPCRTLNLQVTGDRLCV